MLREFVRPLSLYEQKRQSLWFNPHLTRAALLMDPSKSPTDAVPRSRGLHQGETVVHLPLHQRASLLPPRLTGGVAVAGLAAVLLGVAVVPVLTALTVRPRRVPLTVRAVAAVPRLVEQRLVEVAATRHPVAVARCREETKETAVENAEVVGNAQRQTDRHTHTHSHTQTHITHRHTHTLVLCVCVHA